MIKRVALLLPLVVTTAVLAVAAPGAGSSTHSGAAIRTGAATTSAVLTSNVSLHPAKGLGDNWGDNWGTPV